MLDEQMSLDPRDKTSALPPVDPIGVSRPVVLGVFDSLWKE